MVSLYLLVADGLHSETVSLIVSSQLPSHSLTLALLLSLIHLSLSRFLSLSLSLTRSLLSLRLTCWARVLLSPLVWPDGSSKTTTHCYLKTRPTRQYSSKRLGLETRKSYVTRTYTNTCFLFARAHAHTHLLAAHTSTNTARDREGERERKR